MTLGLSGIVSGCFVCRILHCESKRNYSLVHDSDIKLRAKYGAWLRWFQPGVSLGINASILTRSNATADAVIGGYREVCSTVIISKRHWKD